jgi:phosphoribosylformylglycinamidine synthase
VKFAVIVFPGTWSDHDSQYSLQVAGYEADLVWHRETDLSSYDAVVLPGGFSYGDYLRTGAIARFSPVMETVVRDAEAGKAVIGICNGFQVLCESHLLPGALMRNDSLQYRCQWVNLRVDNADTPWTNLCQPGDVVRVPISHGEGRYYADAATLDQLEDAGRVVFRYTTPEGEATPDANPNGSERNIAGIINERGNVLGMMPHPERACEPLLGGEDGLLIWHSLAEWAKVRA